MLAEKNPPDMEDDSCPSCMGRLVSDIERGERICSSCGMVRGTNLDLPSFYSSSFASGSDGEASKTPTSLIMYDIGLPTFIDRKNVDANGNMIHGYSDIEKLRRLNKFAISNDSKTRNLKKAVKEILRITEILGMSPSIAERASYIYRKA